MSYGDNVRISGQNGFSGRSVLTNMAGYEIDGSTRKDGLTTGSPEPALGSRRSARTVCTAGIGEGCPDVPN